MMVEQKRASFALNKVYDALEMPEVERKRYASLAKSLPVMVLTNGLGQTLAFLKAKGKNDPNKPETVLYSTLKEWLMLRGILPQDSNDLLTYLVDTDRDQYITAQQEVLAELGWLKKLAEAFLMKEDDDKHVAVIQDSSKLP